MNVNPEAVEILKHTQRTARYVCDHNSTTISLCLSGLIHDHGEQPIAGGMHYFTLTEKGREFLSLLMPEPKKPREFWIMPDVHHYPTVHNIDPRKSKVAIHGEIIHVREVTE